MNFNQYIKPEFLIITPVLYIIGSILKNSTVVKDNVIPLVLSIISVLLSMIYVLSVSIVSDLQSLMQAMFTAVTQGFLAAGATVLCNQLKKQNEKKNEEDGENKTNEKDDI